nr:hypothetical protein CFP56_45723 [Quercus suber]
MHSQISAQPNSSLKFLWVGVALATIVISLASWLMALAALILLSVNMGRFCVKACMMEIINLRYSPANGKYHRLK